MARFTWQDFADAFTDPNSWINILTMIGGLGGTKSQEAWQAQQELQQEIYNRNHSNKSSGSAGAVGGAIQPGIDPSFSSADTGSSAFESIPDVNEIISYLNGFMTNQGSENDANRTFNQEEAQKQRDWLENMRNSAYQATVQDLEKAGLNPAIALGSGFSPSPIGNSSAASYQQTGGDTISSLLSGAGQLVSAISNFMPASKVVKVFSEFAKKK